MTDQQTIKLSEYLADMKNLTATLEFPIGAILAADEDRVAVADLLKKEKLEIIDGDSQHPDLALGELFKKVKKGAVAVLNIGVAIPPKIINQLYDLIHGQVNVLLADTKKPAQMSDWPESAKVILIMSPSYYDNLPQQGLITSVCRL